MNAYAPKNPKLEWLDGQEGSSRRRIAPDQIEFCKELGLEDEDPTETQHQGRKQHGRKRLGTFLQRPAFTRQGERTELFP
jgi:hypothetical protein